MSNKNNGTELMFLFDTGLSRFINKLSLISNKNLLVSEPKWWNHQMIGHVYKTKGGHVLKVNGEMLMCSRDLTFKCLYVLP